MSGLSLAGYIAVSLAIVGTGVAGYTAGHIVAVNAALAAVTTPVESCPAVQTEKPPIPLGPRAVGSGKQW